MTDSSDCESDAGASPSVSSDESSFSSGSSSAATTVKITPVSVRQSSSASTPKKPSPPGGSGTSTGTSLNTTVTPPTASTSTPASSSLLLTPVSSGRKPLRKRQICTTSSSSMAPPPGGSASTSTSASSKAGSKLRRGSQSDGNKASTSASSAPVNRRKRPSSQSLTLTSPEELREEDSKGALERKRKRNKRRRTRSERNLLAGKAVPIPSTSQTPVVAEGEEAVALDAEIDKVLEEKANKNNLSATNVKSIIRHVITNNMVQKMIMSSMKKKVENPDAAGGSSDDDGLVGPKMTRAKTKELLENQQMSLWPNVYSPVKIPKVPVSETHMLIQHDLPEDSSGDEEYVPKETDISEMLHSDDESSSVASHASDIGSPSPAAKPRVATRRSLQICETPPPSGNDSLFKTPPPRPGIKKTGDESGISRRTRSKFPLKDTALEDLERQLVPPDITQDMYDWGTETDNEDYMAFLKDFLNPAKNQQDPNDMDDDADPEYNVMEEDEDLHDREELRRDRAVKVPKKELTQLIAELFEPGMLSGDDFEDHDLSSLTGITPLVSDACTVDGSVVDSSFPETPKTSQSKGCQFNTSSNTSSVAGIQIASNATIGTANPVVYQLESVGRAQNRDSANSTPQIIISPVPANADSTPPTAGVTSETIRVLSTTASASITAVEENVPLFREQDLRLLQHQIRQHIQLATQSYVLTVSNENPSSKTIAKTAKGMVLELKGFARTNGERRVSNFAVCNLDSAVDVVNSWPHKFLQQSPIKKKILEEKYMSESGVDKDEGKWGSGNHFPRHVVKIIAENPTFLYNNLLPETYSQVNCQARWTFTFSEDALMVRSLEELKNPKRSTAQLADIISTALLVVRPPKSIYHRIRNLRKLSSSQYCDPSIKKYFAEGVLPEIDRTVPEVVEKPLIERCRDGLSSQWVRLLQHFEVSPTYKWEEKVSNDKSCRQKRKQSSKQKKNKSDENEPQASTSSQFETINQVFPNGTYQIENTDPNVQAIPVLDANGKAKAIFWIPKIAMNPVIADGPAVQGIPVELCSPIQVDQAGNEFKQPSQPREALEAGEMSQQENIQGASSTTVNLIGLNHLIRRTQRTPLKATPDDPNQNVPVSATPNSQLRNGLGYHVVQPVGKPFDLNEVGYSFPAGKNSSDNIIDISTLQTPIKNRILQKVTEAQAENEAQEEQESKEEQLEEYDDEDDDANSNVVMEGTEVELTDTEDEDTDPIEPSVRMPEVITLDSDNEDDDEHVQLQEEDSKFVCRGGDGNEGKTNSNTSRDGNSSTTTNSNNHGNENEGSHTSSQSSTSAARKTPSRPGKGDESDDENEKKGGRKRSLPKDYDKDEVGSSKENGENNSPGKDKANKRPTVIVNNPTSFPGSSQTQTQPKPVPSTSSHQPQSSCNNSKSQLNKKAKRSPGNPQANSRRSSKYNVTPAEKLLEDEPSGFDDVADAFMAAYLAKVQAATEKSNPGVYTAFVQTLMDAGEPVNQNELHAKVKVIFKDYTELLSEFESFLDPTLGEGEVTEPSVVAGSGSSSREETLAQIEFFQKIEKFTEKCPQLKSKVLNKIKSLREKPNLTEKDVACALEQFFVGNSVMMESFKALLPGVYRPHSTSSGMDFEEIDLDMEDPPKDTSSEDFHFEVVKLPEETTVPATSTCPCICHTKTSDPAFSNRTKHCRKCSLKFQEGKVYIHNGRVMRPVSVELKPAAEYNKQTVASSTSTSGTTNSSRPNSSTVIHEARPRKDSHHSPHLPKSSSEFKEPCNKPNDKKPHISSTNTQHNQPVHPVTITSKPCSQSKVATTHETEETKHKPQHNNNHEEAPNGKLPMASGDSVAVRMPQLQTTPAPLLEDKVKDDRDWTPEEDTVILTMCQQEPSLQLAWEKMVVLLPQRRIEQIKDRCTELIRLIQDSQHE